MIYLLIGFLAVLAFASLLFVFLRFTFVDEGTDKIVVRFGGYKKTLLAKRGYKVDDDDEIVQLEPDEEPPSTRFGGLRFVGFWPLDKVFTYNFTWVKIKPDGTSEDRHEEGVNHILARDYVYGIKVQKAEDADLVPLDVLLSATAQITNPYKALFGVKDWFGAFIGRVSPYVRKFVTQKSYDEIEEADLETDIFNALIADGIIEELKDRYGIDLHKIEVVDINPGEAYRQMTLQKKIGKMNADQAVEETAGRVLASVARTSGIALEGLKKDLKANPKKRGLPSSQGGYKEAFAYAEDQTKRDRAGAAGELTDIRVGNTDGTSFTDKSLGSLIGGLAAAANQFGKAKGSGGSSSSQGGKKDKSKGLPKKNRGKFTDDDIGGLVDDLTDQSGK